MALRLPASDDLVTAVALLALVNAHQWRLEDECRSRYDDDTTLADLKRRIDISNARRVAAIDQIDRLMVNRLAYTGGGDTPPALATPGEVIDRLSVVVLRWYHAAAGGADGLGDIVEATEARAADLASAFDALIADLTAGRLRIPTAQPPKLYR